MSYKIYDLIIEISEDLTLFELAKSYLEDGVKFYVGYNIKKIYEAAQVTAHAAQDTTSDTGDLSQLAVTLELLAASFGKHQEESSNQSVDHDVELF